MKIILLRLFIIYPVAAVVWVLAFLAVQAGRFRANCHAVIDDAQKARR